MEAKFCQYCGTPLNEGCECLRELSAQKEQWLEDYYNSPETQAGWVNQDVIELGHFHQR